MTSDLAPIELGELGDLRVSRVAGVGPVAETALAEVGIETVLDLLTTYPRRWVDRTNEARVADLTFGETALVIVTVHSVSKRQARNRRTIVNAIVGDDTGRFHVTFFNQPWRAKQLEPDPTKPPVSVAMFGKVEVFRGAMQMTNPIVDMIGDRTGRIVPIYPQSDKAQLSTWDLARWIEAALRQCRPRGLADPIPEVVLHENGLIGRDLAMTGIHRPDTMDDKNAARRRLAFDELLRVQVKLVMRKRALEHSSAGFTHTTGGPLVGRFTAALGFGLTDAQARVIADIDRDLAAPTPMHRLLQGDVGSGKTVVAVTALLTAVDNGCQGALMAPTEVLAEQHVAGVIRLLEGVTIADTGASLFDERPLRVELLTNKVPAARRRDVIAGLADGTVDIVIGTHALIQEGVEFARLGVVVIDEQHRFGVEQRAMLRDRSTGAVPDVLVMTATPIPRTAAMTVYGDLDVSILDELPPGRTPIVTRWGGGATGEDAAWAQVRAEVEGGRQAYVVCPLIEESDKLEASSAESTFERLGDGPLSGLRLGLLHGRMPSEAKRSVMEAFRQGQVDVLVATTVIEVGVDVPNATSMVILDSDRFGIAQLHQLRGRVGRGRHASTCWLLTSDDVDGPGPRVEALVGSTDGFVLAEVDLDLRGEGTIMSSAQKGRSDLKLASLRRDRDLVRLARTTAFELVDPRGGLDHHPVLSREVDVVLSEHDEQFLARG